MGPSKLNMNGRPLSFSNVSTVLVNGMPPTIRHLQFLYPSIPPQIRFPSRRSNTSRPCLVNADGSEFIEFNFGGNGTTDAWGQPGDSRTGAHHIITIAEMMKR